MSLFLILSFLSAQPPLDAPAQPVRVLPGQAPAGTRQVPISQVAEPLALAIAGFDTDADGRTSRAEHDAGLARTFAAADRDANGELGFIEYSGWAETWLGSQNALPGPYAIDADGNDRLSSAEFTAEFGRQFERLDANSDGIVVRAELLTVRSPPRLRERRPGVFEVDPRGRRSPKR